MSDGWRRLQPVLAFVVLLVAWEVCAKAFHIPRFLLPAPSDIAIQMYVKADYLAAHSLVTLREIFSGIALAIVIGIFLAVVIVHSRFLAGTLYPLLVVSQVVPQVAIAPIYMIWFGPSLTSKVLVVFTLCFFPMVVNTVAGLLRVDPDLIDLVRGLNASRWSILTKIRIPNALPNILVGMRLSATLSVIGAVVAEFISADKGLGYLIFAGITNLDTPIVFGAVAVLATTGIALFYSIQLLQKLALPWLAIPREGEA
jgi:NitT/TauT family transport system permease protein